LDGVKQQIFASIIKGSLVAYMYIVTLSKAQIQLRTRVIWFGYAAAATALH